MQQYLEGFAILSVNQNLLYVSFLLMHILFHVHYVPSILQHPLYKQAVWEG